MLVAHLDDNTWVLGEEHLDHVVAVHVVEVDHVHTALHVGEVISSNVVMRPPAEMS